MKKVLILGANGFLGRYLVNNLKGYDIVPITRADVNLSNSISVLRLLEKEVPYAVINCAMPGEKSKINSLTNDDVSDILRMFVNFYTLSGMFTKYINIGSGAEFDRATDIDYAAEADLVESFPKDNYGYIKNTIARLCLENDKFYTLRLFGCFDKTEHRDRIFAKLLRGETIEIVDKEFDFFSAEDFCTVVTMCLNSKPAYKDINCVYPVKLKLSEILRKFIDIHELTSTVNVVAQSYKNYTGAGAKLTALQIPLVGLEQSIRNYK